MNGREDTAAELEVRAPPAPRWPRSHRRCDMLSSKGEHPSAAGWEDFVSCVRAAIILQIPNAQVVSSCTDGIIPITHVDLNATDAPGELPKPPEVATATFILVEFSGNCVKQAAKLLSGPHSRNKLPTLAMLLPPDLASQHPASVTEYLAPLVQSGADDTCALPTTKGDLPAAIAAGILRAEACWQRKISFDMVGRELTKSRMQCERLFWQGAHELVLDLPEINPHVSEKRHGLGQKVFDTKLGAGTFGAVYTWHGPCKAKSGVVKVIPKSSVKDLDQLCKITTENSILRKMRHPNVVHGQGLIHGRQNLYIFMDMAGPSNLCKLILQEKGRGLPRDQVCRFLKSVADGLAHCHGLEIAHCDLKPENVVVAANGCAKIVDFGEAVCFGDEVPHLDGPRGTMPFIAPEILYFSPTWNPAHSDMWSLGVVFIEMLCGFNALARLMAWSDDSLTPVPARADELTSFFSERPGDSTATTNVWTMVASLCRDLPSQGTIQILVGMLQPNPVGRMSAAEVADLTVLGLESGFSMGGEIVYLPTVAPRPGDHAGLR